MNTKVSTKSIARSLAAGFIFGPRRTCACCYERIDDADAVNRGLCSRCWSAILKEKQTC